MAPVYRDLTFSGNGTDAVVLGGGTTVINQNVTLDGRELHGKPFMAYNLNVGQAFTLTAGTNLVFYEGSLNVLSGARLTLDGSPTEPVTLTSAAPDDWKGIKAE